MSNWFSKIEVKELSRILCKLPVSLGRVVEIGTYKGQSAKTLISSLNKINSTEKLICVDPFSDFSLQSSSIIESGEHVYRTFISNMKELGYQDRYEHFRMYSDEFWTQFKEPVRFVLIDGSHEYDYVKSDIRNSYSNLSMGGVLVLDDINFPQVAAAINSTIQRYGLPYSIIPHTKLGFVQKIGYII